MNASGTLFQLRFGAQPMADGIALEASGLGGKIRCNLNVLMGYWRHLLPGSSLARGGLLRGCLLWGSLLRGCLLRGCLLRSCLLPLSSRNCKQLLAGIGDWLGSGYIRSKIGRRGRHLGRRGTKMAEGGSHLGRRGMAALAAAETTSSRG